MKDVIPNLETTYKGIQGVLEELVKSYKAKEDEFSGFQKEYGIAVSSISQYCCFPVDSELMT